MDTQTMITLIVILLMSLVCFFLGIRSWKQKGFLINNAYIYASQEQREKMDKRPWYRQSGVVFCGIGLMFLLTAADLLWQWPVALPAAAAGCLIIYAIVSTVYIQRKMKSGRQED